MENLNKYIININNCNICSSNTIKKIINLGIHTPADTFLSKKKKELKVPKIQLTCFYCKNCLNIQLKKIIKKEFRYNKVQYSYTSSNSKISRKYWNNYYFYIKKKIKKNKNNILEIGANDGYLINKFKKKNNLFAYEASKAMSAILKKNKINTKNEFFEEIPGHTLKKDINFYDIIICNNVLNHCHKLLTFFKNIHLLLSENGFFSLEVPYSPWMIINKKFEIIYLEHINYFSLTSILRLCKKNNLHINKVNFFNYHGQMMRLIISKKKNCFFKKNKILIKEKKLFNNKNFFNDFQSSIEHKKNKFNSRIKDIKKKGYKLVAVGASAKTSSLINYFNLSYKNLDFIVDSSPKKIGKFIPLRRIPIKADSFLKRMSKVYIFFPTWNISKYLKIKIKKINKRIKIINY